MASLPLPPPRGPLFLRSGRSSFRRGCRVAAKAAPQAATGSTRATPGSAALDFLKATALYTACDAVAAVGAYDPAAAMVSGGHCSCPELHGGPPAHQASPLQSACVPLLAVASADCGGQWLGYGCGALAAGRDDPAWWCCVRVAASVLPPAAEWQLCTAAAASTYACACAPGGNLCV